MKKKLLCALMTALMVITTIPASAAWYQNSNGKWSYTDASGYPVYYGWEQIDGKWYYFDNKEMKTGWLNYGYTYYLGIDGAMKTGWVNDGGKEYYLQQDGKLAIDTVVDGAYVDSKGVKQPIENQKVILDNEYVKITYLGADRVNSYYKTAKLKIENKSDEKLIIQSDDVSVDDNMVYTSFSADVMPGKSVIDGLDFSSSSIMTGFNSVEGKFKILNDSFENLQEEDFNIKL